MNSHRTSAKAVLSVSTKPRTIGRHLRPVLGIELKNRLSLTASSTGARHAFKVMFIRLISRSSSIVS